MKLAIVRRRYNSFGGAERFIDQLSSQLKSQIDITIISESWDSPSSQDIYLQPVKVSGLTRSARQEKFLVAAKKIIAKNKFDLVQSHERMLGADLIRLGDGVHAQWLSRYKAVLPWWRRILVDADPFHAAILEAEKEIAKNTPTHFVANSELVSSELRSVYGVSDSRVTIISNGVNTEKFRPPNASERDSERLKLGFSPQDIVLCFVGSGFMRKGLAQMMRALRQLPEQYKLVVAGRDKSHRYYSDLAHRLGISKKIRMLGPMESVRPLYWAADLFVLPTRYDPASNAALEALSCGVPVLSTMNMGMMGEIHAVNAGVMSNDNPEELAQAIITFFSRSDILEISRNAREFAIVRDHSAITHKWISLYEKLLTQKAILL